jgi:hypothetical protein
VDAVGNVYWGSAHSAIFELARGVTAPISFAGFGTSIGSGATMADCALDPTGAYAYGAYNNVKGVIWRWSTANPSASPTSVVANIGFVQALVPLGSPAPVVWTDTLFWVNATGGEVVKVPKRGSGSPIVLASGQPSPWAIAVDDTYVPWANNTADGAILRMAK